MLVVGGEVVAVRAQKALNMNGDKDEGTPDETRTRDPGILF